MRLRARLRLRLRLRLRVVPLYLRRVLLVVLHRGFVSQKVRRDTEPRRALRLYRVPVPDIDTGKH